MFAIDVPIQLIFEIYSTNKLKNYQQYFWHRTKRETMYWSNTA